MQQFLNSWRRFPKPLKLSLKRSLESEGLKRVRLWHKLAPQANAKTHVRGLRPSDSNSVLDWNYNVEDLSSFVDDLARGFSTHRGGDCRYLLGQRKGGGLVGIGCKLYSSAHFAIYLNT